MTKCLASFALLAFAMLLMAADASAASKRQGLGRCAIIDCSRLEVRRKRRVEDPVSRLQKKISRQRLERENRLERRDRDDRYRASSQIYRDGPARSLTCRKARLFLLGQGFYRISPLDCQGRTFTYLARRNGDTLRILVDPRYGRIISANPL